MEALEAAGLTSNEIKVYKVLLSWNKGNVTQIARKTGIHRRNVYDILIRLSEKGLVSLIITDGVRQYQANDPNNLSRILEEKEKIIKSALPDLEKMFRSSTEKKSTQFFMGKKGIKTILEDVIKTKKELLVIGGSPEAQNIIMGTYQRFNILRYKEKIPMKIIYSGKAFTKPEFKKPPMLKLCKTKFMPKGLGGDLAVNIYGDNVALLMWNIENPFAILIRDKSVAASFYDYFLFIWEKL